MFVDFFFLFKRTLLWTSVDSIQWACLLCCLLILCERRFQRIKVLLVLVDDFENDFAVLCLA